MFTSTLLTLASLVSLSLEDTASLQPAASATAAVDDGTRVAEGEKRRGEDEEELSLVDKYYPLSFDAEYHPDVEENLVSLYVIQLFGLMPWGPHVFQDFTPSLEFAYEFAAIYVFHMIFVVPTLYFAWVPIIGWFGVPIWVAANVFYLIPAAVLNAYNRDYIRQRGERGKRHNMDEGS